MTTNKAYPERWLAQMIEALIIYSCRGLGVSVLNPRPQTLKTHAKQIRHTWNGVLPQVMEAFAPDAGPSDTPPTAFSPSTATRTMLALPCGISRVREGMKLGPTCCEHACVQVDYGTCYTCGKLRIRTDLGVRLASV